MNPKNHTKNQSSNNSFNNILDQLLLDKDEFIGNNEPRRKSLPSGDVNQLGQSLSKQSKPSRQSRLSKDIQFLDIESLENLIINGNGTPLQSAGHKIQKMQANSNNENINIEKKGEKEEKEKNKTKKCLIF